jgi:uncharacterized membrane protein
MPGSEAVAFIRSSIEWAALTIEVLGAAVIVAGVIRIAITRGTVRYLFQLDKPGAYESYKHQLGKALLLGLELLGAGDVVRTVALEPTLSNVAVLGLLVVIRTFLGWSLAVEIDGCWPWQGRTAKVKHNSEGWGADSTASLGQEAKPETAEKTRLDREDGER